LGSHKKAKESLFRFILFHIIFFIFCETIFLSSFTVFLIYHGPFEKVKEYVVSTVMETASNHFLATWFLNSNEINVILKKTSPVIYSDKQNLNNVVISKKKNTNIDNAGIQVVNIKEKGFSGKLIVIDDPKRVSIGLTPYLGQAGAPLSEIVKKYKAIGGINAGGFADDNLLGGTGGKPIGVIVENGKIKYMQKGIKTFNVIGFNNNNDLIVSNNMTQNMILNSNLRCAVSFGPALIINGNPLVKYGGTSIQPRSAIGQRKDGSVLLLAIDGRQLNSPGANYMEVQDVLLKYGAYNAANLDGGSSTTLIYQGSTINNPCDIVGERSVPSAFIIMK
jgi:exopolysaccharide biosynthesis protein